MGNLSDPNSKTSNVAPETGESSESTAVHTNSGGLSGKFGSGKLGKLMNGADSSQYSLAASPIFQNENGTMTMESGVSPIKDKEMIEQPADDETADIDPEDNYNSELCKSICVIRDLVGCDRCGIFQYGFNKKQVKIKITKL